VTAYDPAAVERAREILPAGVQFAKDAYEAATGGRCASDSHGMGGVSTLDLQQLRGKLRYPIVLDDASLPPRSNGSPRFPATTVWAVLLSCRKLASRGEETTHRPKQL